MKISKPLRLGILNRPYRLEDQDLLGVSILALASMAQAPQLRPEPELWALLNQELGASDGIVDLGYAKRYPEFLATGYAYASQQGGQTQCEVSIQVDDLQKKLIVSGERHWLDQGCSPAQPFERVRLDWSTAYGGPDFADNPHGIGAALDGQPSARLPQVESPGERITAPDQTVQPVGFGPIGVRWPTRTRLLGERYDAQWMQTRAPGFAEDFDPRYFNIAGDGQIWLDRTCLSAGASYAIHNMHPEHALLQGRLPLWHARCLINRRSDADETLEEIPMRHTTVWFFPHLEQMILVYHGVIQIGEDDAYDVRSLMPALEDTAAPRPFAHYRKVWLQRQDRQTGALHVFQDADLLPDNAIGPWLDTEPAAPMGPLQTNMAARQQQVREDNRARLAVHDTNVVKLDLQANEPPPYAQPALADLPAFARQLEARAQQARDEAEARVRAANFEMDGPRAAAARPTGPQSLHEMRAQLQKRADAHPGEITPEQLSSAEQSTHSMYLHGVERQDAPPRPGAEEAAELRQRVEARLAGDRNFDRMDLTGADLHGLDFSRASLHRTLLENADLSRCRFDGADLREAVLARASLREASLREAKLDGATLFRSDCSHADFSKAILHSTRLQEALLEQCSFVGSRIDGLAIDKTFFVHCRFDHARLTNLIFDEALLRQCTFRQSWLHKVSFMHGVFEQADFTAARISHSLWIGCKIDADFAHSRISNAAFTALTTFDPVSFTEAHLSHCNFRASAFVRSSFAAAKLETCDFSEATMHAADLFSVNASQCNFTRCDLTGSTLQHAKMIGATLKKAMLNGCDFQHANLFRADLSQAETDAATNMEGAYTSQMKVVPSLQRNTA